MTPITHHPPPEDARLSRLLQTWRVDAPDDPALAGRVWRRIESGRGSARWRWLEALLVFGVRPAAALATVVIFAAAGAGVASLQTAQREEARLQRLAGEYVRSIDPVLMTGASAHEQLP